MTRISVSLVTLLLAAPAAAQDYAVSGPAVTGRAEVRSAGEPTAEGQPVSVAVRVVSLETGRATTHTGAGVRTADGTLRWSTTVREALPFTRGIARWLAKPSRGTSAWAPIEREVPVVLTPDGDALTGAVDGAPQRWEPAPDRSDVVVLVIPGLSTNSWNRIGIPYLDENLRALRARGFAARRLKIKTEDSVGKNAWFIRREILREAHRGKRVIVVAHSKGGTDTTAALAGDPTLAKHVAGVIAIQPVYGGSPIADVVASHKTLTGTVKVVFEGVFKGQKEAVLDLTRASRAAFVAEHPYPADRIPTVVIRSSFDRPFGSRSVLWPTQKLIERMEPTPSDGLVTLPDQAIPGAVATIDLDDLDHFEPGVRGESRHTPAAITAMALDALLPHVPARGAQAAQAAQAAQPATAQAQVDLPLGE